MLGTFLITLRELAELALILGTLYACLNAARRAQWLAAMAAGTLLGALIGGAMGASLLDWAEPDLRTTAVAHIAMALAILFLVSTSLLAESRIALDTRARLGRALEHAQAPWAVAGFACFVAGREVLEIVVLLNSVWKPEKAAAQQGGVVLGLAMATALVLLWKRVGPQVESLALFRLSALVTGVVAVEMLVDGAADFLYLEGMERPGYGWMVGLSQALETGAWLGWVSIAIMALPALLVFRSIWRGTVRAGG